MPTQDKLTSNTTHQGDDGTLRSLAEAKLTTAYSQAAQIPCAENLQHELQVYQIELEMQNESLRQTLVALEESRDQWLNFYDLSPVSYLTLDRSAQITNINLTGAFLLGEERSRLVNRRFATYVVPEDTDLWHLHFTTVMKHGGTQTCELKIMKQDGSIMHVLLHSLKLIKDGNSSEARIVLTDITRRKQLEADLLESKKRQYLIEQQEIVKTTQDGFWVVDANNGRILDVNDAYCRLTGYAREEILAMKINDLDVVETPEDTNVHVKKVREVGHDHFETRHRHKLGYLIDFEVSVTHSQSDTSKNFAFFHDITERKLCEEIFRQSHDQLKRFIEQAPICIAMFDRNMNYLAVSNRWTEKYCRGHATLVGLNLYDVYPDIPDRWKLAHRQALTGISLENHEDMWTQRDGSKHWLRWSLQPWIDENNEIGGILISTESMTAARLLEIEVNERRREMEHLQKLQIAAQTASAIAHEMNQPLLAVASYNEAAMMMLKSQKPDYEEIYSVIENSKEQTLRAGRSIRELIDFLHTPDLHTEKFDINKEAKDIVDIAKLERNLLFRSVFKLGDEHLYVQASRTHIQKALLNLLHNGIEAMQTAGVPLPEITVTVSTTKDKNYAQMAIQDNGPGIRKDDLPRLFEPFFTTKAKGIGMGLAISRSLIEQNGGQLWVDPQEGPGAVFHLTLPLAT